MDEFEALVGALNGEQIEQNVKADQYLEATINFWNATKSMVAVLRLEGLSFFEAYRRMSELSNDPNWAKSKTEVLFVLAWAQEEPTTP